MSAERILLFHSPAPNEDRPFSRAVRANGVVYVSGHSAPHDPARGVFRGKTPAEEVRNALNFLGSLLEEAGSSLELIVQMTMLINDKEHYHELNAEYVRHFPNGLPARHTVMFGVPTDALVGFACVALPIFSQQKEN